jgi:hypothetical protein
MKTLLIVLALLGFPFLPLQSEAHVTNNREQQMQKTSITMPEIILVGICVRTSYEQESDKMKGNIFPCVQRYFHGQFFEKIPNRKKPGTPFCAYTNYEDE